MNECIRGCNPNAAAGTPGSYAPNGNFVGNQCVCNRNFLSLGKGVKVCWEKIFFVTHGQILFEIPSCRFYCLRFTS